MKVIHSKIKIYKQFEQGLCIRTFAGIHQCLNARCIQKWPEVLFLSCRDHNFLSRLL